MKSAEEKADRIRDATQRVRLIGREAFQKQVESDDRAVLIDETRGRTKKMAGMSIEKIL